ncbi:hypothetical protein [Bradyrhizobium sp. USDA 3364]
MIVGEIGDVKRAIVFNGDVMNTAARPEELSRRVDGGFLASRAAMVRFAAPPPFPVSDLGTLPIRGRVDGIDVVGIGAVASLYSWASASTANGGLEHDPGKCEAAFRKDHAQARSQSAMLIQTNRIAR